MFEAAVAVLVRGAESLHHPIDAQELDGHQFAQVTHFPLTFVWNFSSIVSPRRRLGGLKESDRRYWGARSVVPRAGALPPTPSPRRSGWRALLVFHDLGPTVRSSGASRRGAPSSWSSGSATRSLGRGPFRRQRGRKLTLLLRRRLHARPHLNAVRRDPTVRAGLPDSTRRPPPAWPAEPRARCRAVASTKSRPPSAAPARPPGRVRPGWTASSLVEASLLSLLDAGPEPEPWVAWMWSRIREFGGPCADRRPGDATGWSHRHVATLLRDQVGLTPKAGGGRCTVRAGRGRSGPEAARRGRPAHRYADQSHLTREVVRYAGEPPLVLEAARRPTAYTALGSRPSDYHVSHRATLRPISGR